MDRLLLAVDRRLLIARLVAHDLRYLLRRTTSSGAQSRRVSIDDAASYTFSAARLMLQRGEIDSVSGKRILELGPGDHLGVLLCYIAWGAESCVAIDRFAVEHDAERQRQIYQRIIAALDGKARQRAQAALDSTGLPRPERIRLVAGVAAEDAARHFPRGSFDLVISVAVGEHLNDVPRAIRALDQVLAPGGAQLHQVDTRDHARFTSAGFGPLEWLTPSERVHRATVRFSGGPNRFLLPDYRALLDGRHYRVRISQVAGEARDLDHYPEALRFGQHYDDRHREMVNEVRPRLARRLRSWSEADLLCAGFFIRIDAD